MLLEGRDRQLASATAFGDAQAVEKLLVQGAYADAETEEGDRCLYVAAELGFLEVVRVLVKFGADVEHHNTNQHENTALHVACLNGHTEVAGYLIDSGAVVDALNVDQRTPLHMACLQGRRVLATYLIQRGSNIRAKDSDNQSPKDYLNLHRLPPEAEHNIGQNLISDRQLRYLYEKYDVNGDGYIDRGEVHKMYASWEHYGLILSDAEVDAAITKATGRKDGNVTFPEFSVLLLELTKL